MSFLLFQFLALSFSSFSFFIFPVLFLNLSFLFCLVLVILDHEDQICESHQTMSAFSESQGKPSTFLEENKKIPTKVLLAAMPLLQQMVHFRHFKSDEESMNSGSFS